VLLLADGDARGATATRYLDQNLGAPLLAGIPPTRQLNGAGYALVRRAIRDRAPSDPAALRSDPPEVVVVLGGTDPDDRTVEVAEACARLAGRAAFTFVAPPRQQAALTAIGVGAPAWRVLAQTPALPELLGGADVVVSAGGTSAWDVAALGIPAVLLAVVPNQQASLAAVNEEGIALGFDLVAGAGDLAAVATAVESLLDDVALRRRLAEAARRAVDGRGGERVALALERAVEAGSTRGAP
jgi:spore coat polysaccharide biosynthesis predicted glycosyltransferase SpsG